MIDHNDAREQKTGHEVLITRIAELEQEREQMLLEILEMRSGIRKRGGAKSDFLSKMAHDLRTPLTKIMGFTEVVRDGMAGPVTKEQKEYLEDVYESACQLNKLINDILGHFDGTGRQGGAGAEGPQGESVSGCLPSALS